MHIDPTQLDSFKNLKRSAKHAMSINLRSELSNPDRISRLSFELDELFVDYSKNLFSLEDFDQLIRFANEMKLSDFITSMFAGERINETENRSVLHTKLRSDDKEVNGVLKKMKSFSEKIISGDWKGFTGKPISDVVNIGIGGSDLGPYMVCEALAFEKNHLKMHFVSNVDAHQVVSTLKDLNPETTLLIVASKTFTTIETMTNAKSAREWFLKSGSQNDVAKHFVAVSTNSKEVEKFGIDLENTFEFWDWVGGRFSLWSSIGLSICLSVGFEKFRELLDGANCMDEHFKNTPIEKNLPVIHGLVSFWYSSLLELNTWAILPYDQRLHRFPAYLQQAIMESNGKNVDRDGNPSKIPTSQIVFGEPGTNGQHAFYQLLHQGTLVVPCDFIGVVNPAHDNKEHQELLLCNFLAQTKALAFGKNESELKSEGVESKLIPFKTFQGNRPTTSILLKDLNPKNLGMLIALYEHTIATLGHLQNIYSFDQWGVELGKILAKDIQKNWNKKTPEDLSTQQLIEKINSLK